MAEKIAPTNKPAIAKGALPTVNGQEESKSDKFKRLVNQRMPKTISRLRQIGALANRNQYEFTPEQVNKILTSLQDELKAIRDKFDGAKQTATGWSL